MSDNKVMRILREVNNYSQAYVASVLDIEQNTYSKLENGQIKLTVDRVKKLASLYKVPVDYFLSDDIPVINYNSGTASKGIINASNFNENRSSDFEKELLNMLLQEKDKQLLDKNEQIELLRLELTEARKEKDKYIQLVEKLSNKL